MFENVFSGKANFNANRARALATNRALDIAVQHKPKVAVVGGGIFGVTSALKLADELNVTLFEKKNSILQAASTINQYRLHRGYHYPRSIETAVSAKNGTDSFLELFPCKTKGTNQYYAIAERDSKVSAREYEDFLDRVGLKYRIAELGFLNEVKISRTYQVEEGVFDPQLLYSLCVERLEKSSVVSLLNQQFIKEDIEKFDYVVNATYADTNDILDESDRKPFQFELCEKLVLKMPAQYQGVGVVVMDGPFMSIDPYGDTGLHVMGNVVHAIHATNVGLIAEIPKDYASLLNRGVIKNPPLTNFKLFMESAADFFEDMENVEHVGSMFTIRTVLPKHDYDDARPSIVIKNSGQFYTLFSGKISTAVDTSLDLHNYFLKN